VSLYVDKFYVAQSEFEDIVFGKNLRDGMIVLLEDTLLRADIDSIRSNYDQARADEVNRWCEVTRLETIPTGYGSLVSFVGVYPDGTQRVRRYSADYAWIVKRVAE
jgi:hypothetical protein